MRPCSIRVSPRSDVTSRLFNRFTFIRMDWWQDKTTVRSPTRKLSELLIGIIIENSFPVKYILK